MDWRHIDHLNAAAKAQRLMRKTCVSGPKQMLGWDHSIAHNMNWLRFIAVQKIPK